MRNTFSSYQRSSGSLTEVVRDLLQSYPVNLARNIKLEYDCLLLHPIQSIIRKFSEHSIHFTWITGTAVT